MFRISRLTDYATSVVLHFYECNCLCSTESISKALNIGLPTASKILKKLVKATILTSIRGANGGYKASDKIDKVTLYDVIIALEGNSAITDCLLQGSICSQELACDAQSGWQQVNTEIKNVLLNMTIKRMAQLNSAAKPDIKVKVL